MTPLEWQLEHSLARSELLIDNGAELTPTMNWRRLMDWGGQTLFRKMLKRGLTDVVDVQEMLEYALRRASSDWVKTVLSSGADPNIKLSDGNSALYHEITRGDIGPRIGVIKDLYRYGADFNEVLDNGDTLLDLAKKTPGANKKNILDFLEYVIDINKD
jgi:ankyrin repeat protein